MDHKQSLLQDGGYSEFVKALKWLDSAFLTMPPFMRFDPLMPGGKQKGHRYLNKPAVESCRYVWVFVTFLLPPGIKGLKAYSNAKSVV